MYGEIDKVPEFILKCQTYEGGLGPIPGVEAHGGYTFCGLACLSILGRVDILDTVKLLDWTTKRQTFLGGFNGRTNKLVDGCYSFWQGGSIVLLELFMSNTYLCTIPTTKPIVHTFCKDLFDKPKLRDYILNAGQSTRGGMRDKPEKHVDFYHTCYCLSGLSLIEYDYTSFPFLKTGDISIEATHPVHNVVPRASDAMVAYFYQ